MLTLEPPTYSPEQRLINRLVAVILTYLTAHDTVTFAAIKDMVQSNLLKHHKSIDELESALHTAVRGLIDMQLLEERGDLEYRSGLPQFEWSKCPKLPSADSGSEQDGKRGSDISVSTRNSKWSVGHMYKQLHPSHNFKRAATKTSQRSIRTHSSTLSGDKFERVRKLQRTNNRKLPGAEPNSKQSMRKVKYTPKSISNGETTSTQSSLSSSSGTDSEMFM